MSGTVPFGSKRKGTAGELEVVHAYRAAGFGAARVPMSGAGHLRGDVKVGGGLGLHLEVKRCERAEIWSWLAQAAADASPGEIPALHFRRSRSDWHVAVPLDAWLILLRLASESVAPAKLRDYLAPPRIEAA